MATAIHGIVAGDESDIHEEPHVRGSRITVRFIHGRVEERGLRPETVADRHNLDVASVYEALAYYHRNPAEMREAEERHEHAGEKAAEMSDCTPE
jgi:uncharacterized protein (DUF433 family)